MLLQRALKGNNTSRRLSILSIGAGTGEDLEVAARYGEVHALDISKEVLELIPDGLVKEKSLGNARQLPYRDGSFDIVLALDVLEHLEDDKTAVEEIGRVLKDGGHLVCTVPAHPFLFGAHDRGLGHHRRYTLRAVRNLFADLDIRMAGYWMFFLFPAALAQRMAQRKSQRGSSKAALPGTLNSLLYRILKLESSLISHGIRLPTGLSIYCTARK